MQQHWHTSFRASTAGRLLADRHYSRQSHGAPQFVPPGRCVVLVTDPPTAAWVTSWPLAEYVKHAWAGAWINSLFRREAGPVASELISAAVAATRAVWEPPPLGIVTMVDADKVRHKRDPGRCYLRAGWTRVGATKGGLLVFQLKPCDMPAPLPAHGSQMDLFAEAF